MNNAVPLSLHYIWQGLEAIYLWSFSKTQVIQIHCLSVSFLIMGWLLVLLVTWQQHNGISLYHLAELLIHEHYEQFSRKLHGKNISLMGQLNASAKQRFHLTPTSCCQQRLWCWTQPVPTSPGPAVGISGWDWVGVFCNLPVVTQHTVRESSRELGNLFKGNNLAAVLHLQPDSELVKCRLTLLTCVLLCAQKSAC